MKTWKIFTLAELFVRLSEIVLVAGQVRWVFLVFLRLRLHEERNIKEIIAKLIGSAGEYRDLEAMRMIAIWKKSLSEGKEFREWIYYREVAEGLFTYFWSLLGKDEQVINFDGFWGFIGFWANCESFFGVPSEIRCFLHQIIIFQGKLVVDGKSWKENWSSSSEWPVWWLFVLFYCLFKWMGLFYTCLQTKSCFKWVKFLKTQYDLESYKFTWLCDIIT